MSPRLGCCEDYIRRTCAFRNAAPHPERGKNYLPIVHEAHTKLVQEYQLLLSRSLFWSYNRIHHGSAEISARKSFVTLLPFEIDFLLKYAKLLLLRYERGIQISSSTRQLTNVRSLSGEENNLTNGLD